MQQFIRVIGVPTGAGAGPNAGIKAVVAVASTADPVTTVQFEFGNLLGANEIIMGTPTVSIAQDPELLSEDDSPLSVVQVTMPAPPTVGPAVCIVMTSYARSITLSGAIG